MSNLYRFKCTDCQATDYRVAAFFEDVATCHLCGGLMFRLDDPFTMPADPPAYPTRLERALALRESAVRLAKRIDAMPETRALR